MTFIEELTELVDEIARKQWELREGRVVPESENVGLGNVGVRLEATILCADLADSTRLAMTNRTIASEVYKAFLVCSSKIMRLRAGEVRSFNGDRVMGVFIGSSRNTNAAKAALNINYAFLKILKPRFEEQYEVLRDGTIGLAHCVGVDTGEVLVARGGIRNNNDLVWVGRAPNIAAKLSTRRNAPYFSYVTKAVYTGMSVEVKVHDGKDMWENRTWDERPEGVRDIYRSNWTWKP